MTSLEKDLTVTVLALLVVISILGGSLYTERHRGVRCIMQPAGQVLCYEDGGLKRLRADEFRVIK